MSLYDYPHTGNYDQDLGFLIQKYNELLDVWNVVDTTIREQLTEWLLDGSLGKSVDKYIDNKFKPYQRQIEKEITDLEKTITTPFNFKGDLATKEDLPMENNKNGDTYYVTSLKYRMTWNGEEWFQSSQSEEQYMDEYENVLKQLGGVLADLSLTEGAQNHLKLLEAIEKAHQENTYVRIPKGDYVFTNSVEIPDGYCVQLFGEMDGYSASMNRQVVGSENHPIHQGSYLMYRGSGRLFTTNVNVILHLKNLMITNESADMTYRRDGRLVGQTTVAHGRKGKVYLENCYIGGFKNCHGRDNINTDEQCSVLASRVRYSQNTYAVSNCVDSRFVDCSFNNNNYDFYFMNNCGATTVANCRLEWSKENNIKFVTNSTIHDIIINCDEFDASYYASINIEDNSVTNLTIDSNIFRRSGRLSDTIEHACHIVASSNSNTFTITNNRTVYKSKDDSKPQDPTLFVPQYSVYYSSYENQKQNIFDNNDWSGCANPNNFTDNMLFSDDIYTNPTSKILASVGAVIDVYRQPVLQ